MKLTVYNTKTRQKEAFEPIDAENVRMYVCGPTVYNRVHIGNARPVVVFDLLYRVLNVLYPKVTYARNITDIDDKIMKTSKETGESIESITTRYADAYAEDMAQLNAKTPDIIPFATQHLPEMIDLVERLIARGHAYESEQHVLFDVRSMANYGELSNRSLDDMLAGARVEVADYKRDAGDFVLWKPSADDEPGWESPWGRGRPGWHLECSAMIEKHLGKHIDIHGGGRDLIFPHHENELAQSCCGSDDTPFVNYWMHNGYVNIDGEKMSKSLGNFRMVNELLTEWHGEVLRYALLSAQYRSEVNFSFDVLSAAKQSLDSFYRALEQLQDVDADRMPLEQTSVFEALLDDLNTPNALAALHQLVKSLAKADEASRKVIKSDLIACGELLGLFEEQPADWFKGNTDDDQTAKIDALIAERAQAKADKNWARADEIRNELASLDIIIEDSASGTTWRKA